MAGITLTGLLNGPGFRSSRGMTLIELIIVVAVIAILLATAVPGYRNYTLRVHRTDAIRMLLKASMCQERLFASRGSYDTSLCKSVSGNQHYQLSYNSPDPQGQSYVAMAVPTGAQRDDPCGSLFVDQSGARRVSASNMSVDKCWSSR